MDSRKEYQIRRRVLADKLPPHSLAIIPAASESLRNGDAHYRFRQDSDFYYLTGLNEPDALLLITANPGSESFLFNLPKDLSKEQWTGMRLGQEAAPEILGVDKAYPLDSFPMRLVEFMAGRASIYYPISRYPALDNNIKQAWLLVKDQVRRGALAPESFHDLTPILSEMRLFKSGAELDLMREAARISVAAHQRAMRFCRQAEYEYQLEAELLYEFIREGCRSVAYDPIVASGDNACILHYTANDKPLRSGDLLLIDAGGEYKNYAADITRTYPVNGRFSAEQRQIYELVLRAQKAGIACIRPGCAWDKIQKTMVEILTAGLVDLGILQGHTEDLIESEAYKPFYMHQSGHWLGLDVHDSGRYKLEGEWRTLQPGMVLTVEPGLYFHPDLNCIDRRWRGIGVRIEDDVHVTADGHENLTHALAVEVEELEAMIRG